MRPVLLEMTGFATFREHTVVDFVGVDYFALVGPTGAGKSTVIDAMTFALYGTVPRWADQRRVSLALAPTTTRGTVRLVFDVSGIRYVVAREIRRTGASVGIKSSRLERLADPTGTGTLEETTEQLAADSQVTTAVSKLLGLEFDHFCKCVVLPQGDFADFLHAKPSEREDILTELLGLGVYDRIRAAAASRSTSERSRAALLEEQHASYADATEGAEQAAAARVDTLRELEDIVTETLPALAGLERRLQESDQHAAALAEQVQVLTAPAVPDGMSALDEQHRAADAAVLAADRAAGEADTAAAHLRETRDAAGERAPLEQAQRDYRDLGQRLARQPQTEQSLTDAETGLQAAGVELERAVGEAVAARLSGEQATEAQARAAEVVARLESERALLTALIVPDGVAELDGALSRAREAVLSAERDSEQATTALAEAESARAAASARSPLEHAGRLLDQLGELLATDARLAAARDKSAATLTERAEDLQAAQGRLVLARRAVDRAREADLVAALRPQLAKGEHCPVCAQTVRVLPPPLVTADLNAANEEVEAAGVGAEQADRRHRSDQRAYDRADAELERARRDAGALQVELKGAPSSRAEVDAQLAEVNRLDQQWTDAVSRARIAGTGSEAARRSYERAREAQEDAAAQLRRARDPLVVLGAPQPGPDVADSWQQLADWADRQRSETDALLTAARQEAQKTAAGLATAHQVRTSATAAETAARNEHGARDRATFGARAALELLLEAVATLRLRLVTADAPDVIDAQLQRLDELDVAAKAASAAQSTAHDAARGARRHSEQLTAQVTTARRDLEAARDPLVALGAPALDGGLLEGWTTLVGWSHSKAAERSAALASAQGERTARAERLAAATSELTGWLVAAGLEPDAQRPTTEVAAALTSSAVATAAAKHDTIRGNRRRAAELAALRDDAQQQAEIASMLASLLRSEKFPRWLQSAALDTLVREASASLYELSGGQFELTCDQRGEFLVVDRTDADSRRPVRTLSGGETFQASLALALALSSQMSSLASEGAARLDSIFLDEGFGTLDESTLEVVAATLENLATGGQRMVGVITHVAALAERVPVRYAVTRDQAGSKLERTSA